MPSRKNVIFAATVLLIALATGIGAIWFSLSDRSRMSGAGTALVGGPFTMTDHTGKRVTDKDFLGKYMLVFFGFTYCPDVCPTELQVMSAALDELGELASRIQPVFVTIDPARDTPQVMREYVASFHPSTIGLTGSEADVAAMAAAYRVYYARQPAKQGDSDYLMDHSTILYLMGPDGKFVRHFTYGTDVKALAGGLREAVSR
jgi:protein SCO1/2